jgi:hypothetical protein
VARLELRTRSAKVTGAVALTALAVAAAATAAAVAPEPGRYRGKTSQDRFASMRVGKSGQVRALTLRWLAKCDTPGYTWGPDETVWSDNVKGGIEQDGSEFSDGGRYHEKGSNGYSARITANMRGHFTSATRAEGRFHIKVDARRDGKHVDWCQARGRWHVARKGGG